MLFGLLVNGLAAPVVEELYFRGYLLPRIPLSRGWAPLLNAALFSLYHLFSPWQNLARTAAVVPIAYAVSWKRSVPDRHRHPLPVEHDRDGARLDRAAALRR